MAVTFDPDKDMAIAAYQVDDRRVYGEIRYHAFGLIDGQPHCLIFVDRGGEVRAISLRRSHAKEYRRHVP